MGFYFPKRFERSEAIERLERFERGAVLKSAVERLERLARLPLQRRKIPVEKGATYCAPILTETFNRFASFKTFKPGAEKSRKFLKPAGVAPGGAMRSRASGDQYWRMGGYEGLRDEAERTIIQVGHTPKRRTMVHRFLQLSKPALQPLFEL